MAWHTSRRKQTLPKNWAQIRKRIGARDNWRCQWVEDEAKCLAPANQCDHVQPSGPDEDWNLRMLCEDHHKRKSSAEGAQAAHARLKALKAKYSRPPERNPMAPPPVIKPQFPGF